MEAQNTNNQPNNAQNGNNGNNGKDNQNIVISIIAVIVILIIIGFGIHHYSVKSGNQTVSTGTSTMEVGTTTMQTNTGSTTVSVSAGPDVTASDINNATYSVWSNSESITLKNGEYKNTNPTDTIFSTVEYFALGDVNGDGHREGIVSITTARADSQDEVFLVTKQNGQIMTTPLSVPVGTGNTLRAVHDITITPPLITMTLDVLGPNDAHCCASIHGTYKYTLQNGVLVPAN